MVIIKALYIYSLLQIGYSLVSTFVFTKIVSRTDVSSRISLIKSKQTASERTLSQRLTSLKAGVRGSLLPWEDPDRDAREAEELHP